MADEDLEIVRGKTFKNDEVVKLDGKMFLECQFNDAVMQWYGGEYVIANCSFGKAPFIIAGMARRVAERLTQMGWKPPEHQLFHVETPGKPN